MRNLRKRPALSDSEPVNPNPSSPAPAFSVQVTSLPQEHASPEHSNATNVLVTPTDEELPNMFAVQPVAADAIFAHFSGTLSIRQLVRLKPVCKQFAALVSDFSIFSAQARCQDDSLDNYYPVQVTWEVIRPPPNSLPAQRRGRSSWGWSGVHHPTGEVHTLPSLEHLPYTRIKFNDSGFHSLLASSGGMLLFALKVRMQHRYGPWNTKNRNPAMSDLWKPLLISNPLTKQWKVLPSPPDVMSASWDYHGARVHLVVDEGANAYTVVLVFRAFLCVYKSTTESWSSSKFAAPIQWGFRHVNIGTSDYVDAASAIMGGKLYYAEMEVAGSTMPVHRDHMDVEMLRNGQVKVYRVDYNEGTWELVAGYALKDHIPRALQEDNVGFGFEVGSYAIGVVECMGGMYVLIPASLDISIAVPDDVMRLYDLKSGTAMTTYEDFRFLPLRFFILEFRGNGMPFGQAFVQMFGKSKLEHSRSVDMAIHECNMKYNPHLSLFPTNCSSWYRYRSWGSRIIIVFSDYVVEYDVLSGRSTTRVTGGMLFKQFQSDVSYMPSFTMKP